MQVGCSNISGTSTLRDCEQVNDSLTDYDVTGSCDWEIDSETVCFSN